MSGLTEKMKSLNRKVIPKAGIKASIKASVKLEDLDEEEPMMVDQDADVKPVGHSWIRFLGRDSPSSTITDLSTSRVFHQ